MSTKSERVCDACGLPIAEGRLFLGLYVEQERHVLEVSAFGTRKARRERWAEETETFAAGDLDVCGDCAERPIVLLDVMRAASERTIEARRRAEG